MSAVSALMAVITPMETGERWLVAAPAPAPPTQPALDTGCRRNCSVAARQMLAQGLSTSYPLGLELKKGFWFGVWGRFGGIFSTSWVSTLAQVVSGCHCR